MENCNIHGLGGREVIRCLMRGDCVHGITPFFFASPLFSSHHPFLLRIIPSCMITEFHSLQFRFLGMIITNTSLYTKIIDVEQYDI